MILYTNATVNVYDLHCVSGTWLRPVAGVCVLLRAYTAGGIGPATMCFPERNRLPV